MSAVAMNTILLGDCVQTMRALPAGLFHCCVTSPPYWNLRSYLQTDDPMKVHEIGSERTPAEFVETMVSVFREVRRVLRGDGVLWVNLGDSYTASGKFCGTAPSNMNSKQKTNPHSQGTKRTPTPEGLQDGDQCLMPHRVAMAMQADGWILRSTIVWAKKSPMPESISGWRWVRCRVKTANGTISRQSDDCGGKGQIPHGNDIRDNHTGAKWSPCQGCPKCSSNGGYVLRRGKWRPTTAHEYVFMFAKSDRYFCDGDAVQEAATYAGKTIQLGEKSFSKGQANGADIRPSGNGLANLFNVGEQRNPRSVWSLSSEPYKGSHFATFPTELARRCIAASTSKAGCCAECGAPYAPVVESERVPTRPGENTKTAGVNSRIYRSHDPAHADEEYKQERLELDRMEIGNRDPQRHVAVSRVNGYRPSCSCAAESVPCRVLDCFGGSGTVGQVAHHMGLDYVLCELNSQYVPLIEERIKTLPRWKKANGKPRPVPASTSQLTLWS